jgi:hypothetical protein
LAAGLPAPRSGSSALNGTVLAEQIGGQIFSDIWGLVVPGNPALAAEYAGRASRVTHDGEAVHGGRFIAGLVSQAFSVLDPVALVKAGLDLLPPGSEYARVVRAMLDHFLAQPADWRSAYQHLARHFGYDRYGGTVHVIPNAGVVVLALLYGQGDFSQSVRIAAMAGWDTDCNAGNVGAIMGVAVGLPGIDPRWRAAMNDVLVAASLVGSQNLHDLPACADRFSRLGAAIAGVAAAEPPRPLPRYHFDFPGSTHGFEPDAPNGEVLDLRQVSGPARTGRGALQVSVRHLGRNTEARVFTRLVCAPSDLSANYYGASFSPKLYPGQTLTAQVYVPPHSTAGLGAALYAWDDLAREQHQSSLVELVPGEWQSLVCPLPELKSALFSRAGLLLRSLHGAWNGHVLLDALDWRDPPRFSTDFSRERPEFGAICGWTFLRGYWRLEDRAYHGSGAAISETYTGAPEWQDLDLTVELVPLAGEAHNANLRVQGARRSYAVGLAPGGRLVIYKNAGGYVEVAEASFPWQHGQRYRLRVQAQGPALTASVNDQAEVRWADPGPGLLRGQIGLSNFAGCHTRFEGLSVVVRE